MPSSAPPPRREYTWAGAAVAAAAALGLLLLGALAAGVLDTAQGCPEAENPRNLCMGPRGTYWTVWGEELRQQALQGLVAAGVGAAAFVALTVASRRGVRHSGVPGRAAASLVVVALAFLAVTGVAPTDVAY